MCYGRSSTRPGHPATVPEELVQRTAVTLYTPFRCSKIHVHFFFCPTRSIWIFKILQYCQVSQSSSLEIIKDHVDLCLKTFPFSLFLVLFVVPSTVIYIQADIPSHYWMTVQSCICMCTHQIFLVSHTKLCVCVGGGLLACISCQSVLIRLTATPNESAKGHEKERASVKTCTKMK